MKYTLRCENTYNDQPDTKFELEFEACTLEQMEQNILTFLRASGWDYIEEVVCLKRGEEL